MADGQKKPQRKTKGRMARELVYYCIYALTLTLAWAVIIKTLAIFTDHPRRPLRRADFRGGCVRRGAAAPAVQESICKTK